MINVSTTDCVRIPKTTVLAALQSVYPEEFGDKTVSDLDSYGRDPFDTSFILLTFKEELVSGSLSQIKEYRFVAGAILQLLASVDVNFADRDLDDLISFLDDEADDSIIVFKFVA